MSTPKKIGVADAGIVCKKISYADVASHVAVIHSEIGQILGYLVVPIHFALVDQHPHRDHGHCLSRGHAAEKRSGIDLCILPEFTDPITL